MTKEQSKMTYSERQVDAHKARVRVSGRLIGEISADLKNEFPGYKVEISSNDMPWREIAKVSIEVLPRKHKEKYKSTISVVIKHIEGYRAGSPTDRVPNRLQVDGGYGSGLNSTYKLKLDDKGKVSFNKKLLFKRIRERLEAVKQQKAWKEEGKEAAFNSFEAASEELAKGGWRFVKEKVSKKSTGTFARKEHTIFVTGLGQMSVHVSLSYGKDHTCRVDMINAYVDALVEHDEKMNALEEMNSNRNHDDRKKSSEEA